MVLSLLFICFAAGGSLSLSESLRTARNTALEKHKQLELERVPAHPDLAMLIPILLINMSDAANDRKPCYEIETNLLFNQDWERLYGTTDIAPQRRLDALVALETEWDTRYPDLKCNRNNCNEKIFCGDQLAGTLKWCWEKNTDRCCMFFCRSC